MACSLFASGYGVVTAVALVLGAGGCSRTPAEPDPPPPVASAAPAVAPLTWDAPGSWTTMAAPRSGPKKAMYKVPHVGNDKEDAEVTVFFFGTGALGDVDKNFKEWFGQFDGDVESQAKRETFETKERKFKGTIVDTNGTYKVALGPPVGPKKKAPVAMVKQSYRLLGAVVQTADQGNWFFKMTGPDETVQAAHEAFRLMLESAR